MDRYYELIAGVVLRSEGDVTQFCGPEVIAHYGLIKPIEESSVVTPVMEAFRGIGLTLESEFQAQFGAGLCRGTVTTTSVHGLRSPGKLCSATLHAKFQLQRMRINKHWQSGCGAPCRRFDFGP